MKQILLALVVFLLCAATAIAGNDRRKEKLAEERSSAAASFSVVARPNTILDWAPFNIESATSRYKGIAIVGGNVVWINGNENSSTPALFYGYRSVDGGTTWKGWTATLPAATGGVTNIAAKDSSIAVFGTDLGDLYRTKDGGATWDSVFAYGNGKGFMDGVMTVGATGDTMIALGDADAAGLCVARSTNAGLTWTRLTLPSKDSLTGDTWYASYYTYGQAMDVYGSKIWMSLYYGSGYDPRILVSTDAGNTWDVFATPLPGGNSYDTYFRSINFLNENVGWGVAKGLSSSSTSWAVKTTDGGKTWSDTINVQPGVPHSEATPLTVKPIRGTANVFAGGYQTVGENAWWSNDSGKTWTKLPIPAGPTNAIIYNAGFIDAQHGFAIGREQNLKLTPATAISDPANGMPARYALSQNYPNPFNPTTTISYMTAKEGNVSLAVYDVLGRLVTTLVNEHQAPGQYTVRFDGSRLSSGIYYYTLHAGDFVSTKSLVLMK